MRVPKDIGVCLIWLSAGLLAMLLAWMLKSLFWMAVCVTAMIIAMIALCILSCAHRRKRELIIAIQRAAR